MKTAAKLFLAFVIGWLLFAVANVKAEPLHPYDAAIRQTQETVAKVDMASWLEQMNRHIQADAARLEAENSAMIERGRMVQELVRERCAGLQRVELVECELMARRIVTRRLGVAR